MIRKLYSGALNLIFPRRCPVCDEIVMPHGQLICATCMSKLKYVTEPYCRKCGKSLSDEEKEYCFDCMHKHHRYDRGRALYEYSCVHTSIYRFKYSGRREYAKFYGEQLACRLGRQIREWQADVLVPVPLHVSKQRKRGYNQAELLAKELGNRLGIPVESRLIERMRRTVPQKELSNTERQNNLKKAFKICQNDVKLRVVIVIDDIYTTGSTINEIAAVLKDAGVKRVFFITLAIGNGL